MKTLKVVALVVLAVAQNSFAVATQVYNDDQLVSLVGSVATIYRPLVDGDDKEIVEKCGPTYSAFLLATPIKVMTVDPETGDRVITTVSRLSLHSGANLNKALTKVSGRIFEITAGTCNQEAFGISGN